MKTEHSFENFKSIADFFSLQYYQISSLNDLSDLLAKDQLRQHQLIECMISSEIDNLSEKNILN